MTQFKLAGVSHRTPETRAFIETMRSGEQLYARREPGNKFDANAIQIWHEANPAEAIGYAPKEVAAEWAPRMDRGGLKLIVEVHGPQAGHEMPIINMEVE